MEETAVWTRWFGPTLRWTVVGSHRFSNAFVDLVGPSRAANATPFCTDQRLYEVVRADRGRPDAKIDHVPGCADTTSTNTSGIAAAVAAAAGAEVALVFVGLSPCGDKAIPTCNEGESHDRNHGLDDEGALGLPGAQQRLVAGGVGLFLRHKQAVALHRPAVEGGVALDRGLRCVVGRAGSSRRWRPPTRATSWCWSTAAH